MNTIDILKKTIKLIETNLESQDLNITFLSNKVFVSPFYLQRIFYSFIGNFTTALNKSPSIIISRVPF